MNTKSSLRFLKMLFILLSVVLIGCFSTFLTSRVSADADYWPMFGHDSAHTERSSVNGPNTADLLWTYPDEIVGEVVVGPDGTIYGSSYSPSILRAINPNGTLKWEWPAGFGNTLRTPAIATDGTIYVSSSSVSSAELLALSPVDGSSLWSYLVSGNIRTAITLGADGTIYFGTDFSGPGALYAINPNGTLKWKWDAPATTGFEGTAIAINPYNGDLVFRCTGCGLVSVKNDGQLRWMTNDETGNRENSPSIGPDGTIYIGRRDYYFRAFNPDDGSLKWATSILNWMNAHASAISADGSTIYSGDNGGMFYAFDHNGDIKWQYDTGLSAISAGISSTPALSANGIVYFTSEASTGTPAGSVGKLYAVRAADGVLLWTYNVGWGASPVLGPDGTLYVTAYTGDPPSETYHLYAFRCANGLCTIPSVPDLVQDGGFEAGFPNAYWQNYSSSGYQLICNTSSCGGAGARTGNFWAYFGGVMSSDDEQVWQSALLPVNLPRLSFWLRIPSVGTFSSSDYLAVQLDGNTVFSVTGNNAATYNVYKKVNLDISAYADGGVHMLSFVSSVFPGSSPATAFYVDDVGLDAIPTVTPTYTPTESSTPTPTITATSTFTQTLTGTSTQTITPTPTRTVTQTFTITPTKTLTPTITSTKTSTRTHTPTKTPATLMFTSVAAQDGWILESSETSNIGGTLNASTSTFQLGDDAANRQYRAILSFNTISLPDNASIQSAVLKIRQSGSPTGANPFNILGSLWADICQGPFSANNALQLSDFNATASAFKVGAFGSTPAAGWYTDTFNATGRSKINKAGMTQLRLYFAIDDNNNHIANFMKFISGNSASSKPVLVIIYSTP